MQTTQDPTAETDPAGHAQPGRSPLPVAGLTAMPLQTETGYELLTTAEVAALLRVSPSKVRQLHRSGRLRAHPDFPTKLLFRLRDVLAFIGGE